jgi:uncharacterized protein YeaO (DUF488 family)
MVNIKRIYDPLSTEDGKRLLVDRIWPRGIKKGQAEIAEWLKEIAPSTELRKWFGHDPAKWDEFRSRYIDELAGEKELLERLRREAGNEKITLVYAARDTEHNNAVVLKELLEQGV